MSRQSAPSDGVGGGGMKKKKRDLRFQSHTQPQPRLPFNRGWSSKPRGSSDRGERERELHGGARTADARSEQLGPNLGGAARVGRRKRCGFARNK